MEANRTPKIPWNYLNKNIKTSQNSMTHDPQRWHSTLVRPCNVFIKKQLVSILMMCKFDICWCHHLFMNDQSLNANETFFRHENCFLIFFQFSLASWFLRLGHQENLQLLEICLGNCLHHHFHFPHPPPLSLSTSNHQFRSILCLNAMHWNNTFI